MTVEPKKMTDMDRITTVTPEIIVLVVADPEGDAPVNKVMDLRTFLSHLPCPVVCEDTFSTEANTSIGGSKMEISANTKFLGRVYLPRWTPTSSSETAPRGRTGFDDTYLYCAIADNTIRRIPWQTF